MTAHRPSKPRFFLVLTLLLALVSCTPAATPTSEAMLTAMRAVPGTRDAIVHAFSTGYAFSVTLEDNPSAETLQHVLEAYANGVPALNGQVSCVVMWRSTKVRHRLSISSSRDHFVPDPASLTQLVEWPADLAVDADVQRSGFSVDVHSTDATFTKDLSRFLKARPVVDRMRVLSPRFAIAWDSEPPVALFDAVAAAAPDASAMAVSAFDPDPASPQDATIEVAWPETANPDAYLKDMHAVTDIWASQHTSTLLGLSVGETTVVALGNNACPNAHHSRNAEFWAYATRNGHRIAKAPASC